MKQCPQCLRSYDDSQSFCLMDGTLLVVEDEQQTVVRPQQISAPKKSKTPLLIGIIAILFLAVIGLTAALFLYKFSGQSETAKSNNQNSAAKSPSRSTTPKTTPTANTANNSVNANSSPAANTSPDTEETPQTNETDEITPIAWTTNGTSFKNDVGMTYKFQCPPNGTENIIWGSDIYTTDSSICTAGVHAGIITLEDGGIVTVEFRPGRLAYGSTDRHGIKSATFGEYPRSYVVR